MRHIDLSDVGYDFALHHAGNHMSIPYQVYDEVLDEECMIDSYLLELHNWALHDSLKDIGIVVKIYAPERFTLKERKGFFTVEYCTKVIREINDDLRMCEHRDLIAIRWLESVRKFDNIEVWFKGVKLFQ